MSPKQNWKVGVIGASGMAGQSIIEALDGHPWFTISSLHGSPQNVGKKYQDVRRGFSSFRPSEKILQKEIVGLSDLNMNEIDFFFSAVPKQIAQTLEPEIAIQKPVLSTSSAHRYTADIPIVHTLINPDHLKLLKIQQENRGWNGFILPCPHPTVTGLGIATYPIFKQFGIKKMHITALQAVSGRGYPGLPAMDLIGNIIPHITNIEEKIPKELKKIFGIVEEQAITAPDLKMGVKCFRVPILAGYMLSVFLETVQETNLEEIQGLIHNFNQEITQLELPSLPVPPIQIFNEKDRFRPQPRVDTPLNAGERGMTTFLGGLSATDIPNGFKFTVLVHNMILGGGRGSVLNAEYLVKNQII